MVINKILKEEKIQILRRKMMEKMEKEIKNDLVYDLKIYYN
jgi:hypothetical protein